MITLFNKTFTELAGYVVLGLLFAFFIYIIYHSKNVRAEVNDQVIAVAEDLGCTFIEQSYRNPENFYIDCGDDEIRIIKLEK